MKTKLAVWLTGVVAAVLAIGPVRAVAETVVLPVVARGVPGINGSVWDSEVRISGPRRFTGISVRRAWVALRDGGFVDDSATAPHWVFPTMVMPAGMPYPQLFIVLTGDQLLQATDASKGAVALEIEGTGNHVFLHRYRVSPSHLLVG
jgi:hypothetical protein